MGEPGSSRGWPRGVESPGEESLTGAVAAQAIEAQPPFGEIKPRRGRVVRAPNSILGRRHGGRRLLRTRGRAFQAKEKKPWRTEGTPQRSDPPGQRHRYPQNMGPSHPGGEADLSKRYEARASFSVKLDERLVIPPISN